MIYNFDKFMINNTSLKNEKIKISENYLLQFSNHISSSN